MYQMRDDLIKISRELSAFYETHKQELNNVDYDGKCAGDDVGGCCDTLSDTLHHINIAIEEDEERNTKAAQKYAHDEERATKERD